MKIKLTTFGFEEEYQYFWLDLPSLIYLSLLARTYPVHKVIWTILDDCQLKQVVKSFELVLWSYSSIFAQLLHF